MKFFTKEHIPFILFGILIILSFINPFYSSSITFEDKAAKEISESILILEEIETLSIPLAENVPFLKSWAHTYETDFDKLLNYINFANLLMLFQLGLLKLSEWWLFKGILILAFFGLFLNQTKALSKNILIIGLMITPGLGFYTQFMSGISNQMEIDLGADLKSHLQATKDSISSKKAVNKESLDTLESIQKAKHKGKLNLINKVEDEVINVSDKVSEEVYKLGKDLLDILRFGSNHGLELAISLLSNILIIFGILPFLFWYLISLALKRLFNDSKPLDEIDKKLEELKSITKTQLPKS
ncbi:hypothetical protein [Algoriphagus sp.]|uniref:hypothetical protein n=1 Tax=Algoriphagus sp. TaxID=1872435 RepID=UPI0025EF655C|nr:hypothetical protein [Algoriphagus sp.]